MQSFQEVYGRRVGEAHVVFDLYGARWILRVDKPRDERLWDTERLRFRGVVVVERDDDTITRMTIPRVSVKATGPQSHRGDVSVWLALTPPGESLVADRLDEARARVLWRSGPTPPDAPPCVGLPASRWLAPDPTTTFVLPNGESALAVLYPSRRYGAGRGEWMPLRVRPAADDPDAAPAAIVATYDYGRERQFASLAAFLDAHDITTDGESYREQDPAALAALAQIAGLAWHPTHRVEYHDRDEGDDSAVWFVDASAAVMSLADEGPMPAPSFAEVLRGAPAMFSCQPGAVKDASSGWAREGVPLHDAHPDGRPFYEVEALYPSP